MRTNGPWKLPMGHRDRIVLFWAKVILRFSWFRNNLYVKYPYTWSPSYSILLSFLGKKGALDTCVERSLQHPGLFSFTVTKQLMYGDTSKKLYGNGVSEHASTALSKAIGEMLEREITGLKDSNNDVITDCINNLGIKGDVLNPAQFHRFLPQQKKHFPELGVNNDTVISWVSGENLITNKKVFIPRHMTSWFFARKESSNIFSNPTTNGSALAFTKEEATTRGILEVVQRDAFFVHWLTGVPPNVIDQKTLSKDLRESVSLYEARGITLYILNTMTNILIPSVCVVAINREAAVRGIAISAASAFSFEEAIRDSLREMAVCSQTLSEELAPIDDVEPFISDLDKSTRLAYLRGEKRVNECMWFVSGESIPFDGLEKYTIENKSKDVAGELRSCLSILEKMGKDYYPVVYYPQNALQKDLGFFIAQVFIPKAFPLYLIEKFGTFDSNRLHEFAKYKGHKEWKITKTPHMFT